MKDEFTPIQNLLSPMRGVVLRLLLPLCACLLTVGVFAEENTANEIEELIVNATRLPRAVEDIAGTVSVVTAEDIEREMAEDLDDLIRFHPGVSVNTASRGGNEGFTIRGIGGNRVLTVIDGVRSNDIYHAGPSTYGRDNIDTDQIKSLELLRGPASVLYGADAIGGAVILTSKEPADYLKSGQSAINLATSAADANDLYRGGFRAALRSGSLSMLTQFTHREFAEQDVNSSGQLNPQDGGSDSLLVQAYWDVSPEQQLRLSIDRFVENVETELDSDLGRSVSSSFGEDDTTRQRVGVRYTWQADLELLDDLEVDFSTQDTDAAQYTEQSRTSYSFINPRDPRSYGGTSAIRKSTFEFNQQTSTLGLNMRKTITSSSTTHSFAYGANRETTDTTRPRNRCEENVASGQTSCRISAYPFAPPEIFPNKTIPDTSTTRYGIYLQDEIAFATNGLTLIPGLRYDRYRMKAIPDQTLDGTGQVSEYGFPIRSIDNGALSLNLGVLYDVNENWSYYGQYAEGYRPPNFAEANQSFVNLGFQYATVPNPELTAETSRSVELGLRGSFANSDMSVSVYRNQYEDFIENAFVGARGRISLFQNQNIGSVEIQGVEINSLYILNEQWRTRVALAYARGDNQSESTPLDSVEPLTLVGGLRFDAASDRWGGEVLLSLVGKKDRVSSPDRVTAKGYQVLDVIGYLNFSKSLRLRIGIFNVLDERYARWTNISGLSAESTSAIDNAHQPGTNLRVGLQYDI